MVEDRIAALEDHAAALEERVRDLEAERKRWNPGRPEAPPRESAHSPAWPDLGRDPDPSWPPPSPGAPLDGPASPGATTSGPPSPAAAAPGAPSYGPPSSGARPADQPRATWTPPARPAKPQRDLEDVLGGSVLAWLGGVAILAGLAFLLTIAISRGWLGEGARTVLAGLLSAGLLGTGIWLREHKDRTEAALAAAAVGVAGLFGTILIAGAVYELVPTTVALAGAFVVGSAATYLATRWNATLMGWLGLLGALFAPAALGAIEEGVVYLAIAYTATIAVVVWQRWNALAWAAFVLATLQFAAWADGAESVVAVLAVFGVLNATLALGLEARRPGLNLNTAFLLAANAALLVLGHWDEHWFIAIAAAHAIAGLALIRAPRISRPAALITLGIGVGLADLALASLTSGLPVVLGWAGPVLAFAALLGARRRPPAMDQLAAELRTTFTLSPTGPAAPGTPAAATADTAPGTPAATTDTAPGTPAATTDTAPGTPAAAARRRPRATSRRATGSSPVSATPCSAVPRPSTGTSPRLGSSHSWSSPSGTRSRPRRRWTRSPALPRRPRRSSPSPPSARSRSSPRGCPACSCSTCSRSPPWRSSPGSRSRGCR